MKTNRILGAAPLCAAALLALMAASCIDKDYDMDNVDLTVGVGNHLQLPSNNSTQDICLDDVLDLGNNNFLTVGSDGLYNIDAIDDDEFVAHQAVPQFTVPSKSYKGTYTINLGDFGPAPAMSRGVKGVKRADDEIAFTAPMVDLDFTFRHNTSTISYLEHIGFSTDLSVNLTFAKDLQDALSNIQKMTIALPQCIDCGKAAFRGDSIALEGNVLTLSNVKPSEGVKVVLRLTGIDLSGKKADGSYMSYVQGTGFTFHGALTMGVVVRESAVDFDKVAEGKDLSVSGTAVINSFTVKTARGGFTPRRVFGKVGGVSLRDVPSFLTDDDVNLDLYDPQLNINITSNVPFANKMTAAIVSKDSKGNVLCRLEVPEFSYKAMGNSIVSIRRRPASHESDTTVVVMPEMCDVIRNLPDSICLVDLEGVGDDSQPCDIELSNYYQGRLRLSVASGISLGDEARIVYKDDYRGWNEQIKDIRFVETTTDGQKTIDGYLKVNATIKSKVPAFLTLKAYGIDMQGREIGSDRLEVTVEKVVKASPDGVKAATTEEVIYVRPKDNAVFKELDGLAFRIVMTAANGNEKVTGVKLNAYKQTIKVTDITVQKFGKVAVDLN